MVAVAGCGSTPAATNLLCTACTSDSQCGGNPCYADVTGHRFCGRPCDGGCPNGYSCLPLEGTGGQVVKTCFPSGQSCATAPPPGNGGDMALPPTGPGNGGDMAFSPCTPPTGGTVSINGGTVDRFYFGYTGDTRPSVTSSSYPQSVQDTINRIFMRMAANGVEFMMDGGDHMEASSSNDAQGNMASYAEAAKLLGKPVFMTMGNHECSTSFSNDCGYAGAETQDYKMSAYMSALKQVSGATSPYYRFDLMTQSGKAVFLVVADDAWNTTQEAWLTQQLTDADANARYTFVSKHHPDGNTDQMAFQQIYNLVTSHKYTLFLTGHSHEYKHTASRPRAVVMGLGGAPLAPNASWWGYLTVMQCPDDRVNVTVYDQGTGNVQDQFSVPPQ
jgi:hypothetical protein